MTDKFKDQDQRFFTSREIDEQEADRARRALLRQGASDAEPALPPAMSRAERMANLSRLSDLVGKAVDQANAKRTHGKEG